MLPLRRTCWSGLLLIVGIGLLVAADRLGAADKEEKKEEVVTADQITKEYATDPAGFNKKFKDKVVIVEGTVVDGGAKDSNGKDRFLMLGGFKKEGDPVAHWVRCLITPDFAGIRIGHKVQIKGTVQAHKDTLYAAELRDCKVVKVVGDDYPPSKAVQEEIKKLQGRWQVVAAEADGKKLTGKDIGIEEIEIDGHQVVLHSGNGGSIWGLVIDPGKNPKVMDIITSEGKKVPLIFAFEKEQLRLVLPPAPKEKEEMRRPESFDVAKGGGLLVTAERKK